MFLSVIELLPNSYIQKYFFWKLIPQDMDDEKFVDCAIAAGSEYLITNDRHFSHLKNLPFPIVNVVNEDEFRLIFEKKYGIVTI